MALWPERDSCNTDPLLTVFVDFTILSFWCQIPEDINTGGLPLANDGQAGFDQILKLFELLNLAKMHVFVTILYKLPILEFSFS